MIENEKDIIKWLMGGGSKEAYEAREHLRFFLRYINTEYRRLKREDIERCIRSGELDDGGYEYPFDGLHLSGVALVDKEAQGFFFPIWLDEKAALDGHFESFVRHFWGKGQDNRRYGNLFRADALQDISGDAETNYQSSLKEWRKSWEEEDDTV